MITPATAAHPAPAPAPFDAFTVDLAGPRLVEASAGTGKTHAIGSLVLRLLVEGAGAAEAPPTIEQILVVTFTRAATGELRERIRSRLLRTLKLLTCIADGDGADGHGTDRDGADRDGADRDGADRDAADRDGSTGNGATAAPVDAAEADVWNWLKGLPLEARQMAEERLRDALRDYDEAAIFTIHGFCQRVLRDFAFESRVDFDAELVPDETALRRTAIHDYWARVAYGADPVALHWLMNDGRLGVTGMEQLGDALARSPHLERVPALDRAEQDKATLDQAAAGGDGSQAPAGPEMIAWRRAFQRASQEWRAGGAAAMALLAQAAADGRLNKSQFKPETIRGAWTADLEAHFAPDRPTIDDASLRGIVDKLAGLSDRKGVNKGGDPPEHPFFGACEALSQARQEVHAALDAWGLTLRHGLADWLAKELPERKRRARQQSFDDLLHQLHHALTARDGSGERLARRIRGRYRAALIDEFQDTDLLQADIFGKLFDPRDGEAPPFLRIGDPKQAIYAFRGADVFAYLGAVKGLGEGRRHTLSKNYRSDQGLVEALNALWLPVERPFLFEAIGYEPASANHLDRLEPGGPALEIAYLPAEVADRQTTGKPVNRPPAERAAARAAAAAVVRLLASPPQLGETGSPLRAATAGDVAVLVRTNAQARRMQHALRDVGIPSVLYSDASVLDQPEAETLRLLLAALQDPSDAWALRAALVTPVMGLDAAALDRLAGDEEDWERWVEHYRGWRDSWQRRGFFPAFRQLLDESQGASRLLAQADGERRLTNLLHLAELLHSVAVRLELGPDGLVVWLDRVREDAELRRQTLGDTAQLRLERDAAAVKLVTTHRSKGLEYPFVFCPFLWTKSRTPGAKDAKPIAFHDLDGEMDGSQGLRLDIGAVHGEAATQAAGLEALAEDLRLLYVALTRARHRCWLVWGPFNGAWESALAYVLFSPAQAEQAPVGDASEGLETWRKAIVTAAKTAVTLAAKAGDPAEDPLWRALAALAAAAPERIGARRLKAGDLHRRPASPVAQPGRLTAVARQSQHPPRRVLSRSSFTALARGEREDGPTDPADGQDHDARAAGEATELAEATAGGPAATSDADDRVPLADLVAGTRLGVGMHALLERIDFRGDGARWRREAERLVARRALPGEALEPLLDALPTLLNTPLGIGEALDFRLADIGRGDRRDELNYILPVALQARDGRFAPLEPDGGVTPAAIAAVLERHPGGALPADYPRRLRALSAAPLAGWLNGSLDLVFRRGEGSAARWFLLDWKSNRLGDRWADYAPERLTAAMAGHHYFLQAHLYALALHRHLTARLPGYSYERHFGGILYVFVRGVRQDHPGSGVCFDRPPVARIQALDRLLREGRS